MTLKKNALWIILLNILLLMIALVYPKSLYIVLAFCIWIDIIYFCFCNIGRRIYLFVFLMAFFVFLMGRELLDVFGLHTVVSSFSDEVNAFAEKLLIISLLFLLLGYVASNRIRFRVFRKKPNDYNNTTVLVTRQVSLWLFYITFVFSAIQLIDVGRHMIQYGYLSTYTDYQSSIPYFITKIAEMTPISFWIFLATMPSLKEVKKHGWVFGIYLCMTLLTGKRFSFVSGFFVLIAYFVMRNSFLNDGKKWIGKKIVIIMLASIPVLSVLLFFFSRVRSGIDVSGVTATDAFTDFFYGQGVSINVIKYSHLHELGADKKYLFSSTMTFLQKNIISRALGVKSYSGNTVDNAINGNSLAHALSYFIYGSQYLGGRGIGSCYIAEAFHDFRYYGVALVNFIYGVVLNRFFDFRNKGVYGCTIALILLDSLLKAPRGSADGFVAEIVDFTTWGTIIVVFVLVKLIIKGKTVPSARVCEHS